MNLKNYIDHTLLAPTATKSDIEKLCNEAKAHHFYAVCVNGCYTKMAADLLNDSDVKIATVIGFPLGASSTESKISEALSAIEDGADEIDMVLNVGYLKSGMKEAAASEVKMIKDAIGDAVLKVILETCYLNDDELFDAIEIAAFGNADYIKTSTGFGSGGANEEVVKKMLEHAGTMKVKASGGIRDAETALKYIDMGVSRLGTSSGVAIVTADKSKNNEHTY